MNPDTTGRLYICSPVKSAGTLHMVPASRDGDGDQSPRLFPSFAEGTCFPFMSTAGTLLPLGRELFWFLEDEIVSKRKNTDMQA